MSHIATQNFYKKVALMIEEKKKQGFVLFFEWVRPWMKENEEKFHDALWVKITPNTYKNLSLLYGLVPQDNTLFLGKVNDKDYNVDISMDDIIFLYEQMGRKENTSKNQGEYSVIDIEKEIDIAINSLTEKQLKIVQYVNRGFMNFFLKNQFLQDILYESVLKEKDIFHVILHKRNEEVVKEIIRSQHDRIVLLYGMLHFEGIFEWLKNEDNTWKILQIEYEIPLK